MVKVLYIQIHIILCFVHTLHSNSGWGKICVLSTQAKVPTSTSRHFFVRIWWNIIIPWRDDQIVRLLTSNETIHTNLSAFARGNTEKRFLILTKTDLPANFFHFFFIIIYFIVYQFSFILLKILSKFPFLSNSKIM